MSLFGLGASPKPVLVLGASGSIGSEVVRQLLAAKNVSVIALARDPAKVQSKLALQHGQHEHLAIVKGDFDSPDTIQHAALNGQAHSALLYREGTNAGVLNALKSGGVTHIVYISTSFIGLPLSANSIQQAHSACEDMIKAAGFTYTFLRAEAFMSNVFQWKYSIAHGVVKVAHADAPQPIISIEDIASVAVTALTGSTYNNQVLTITGPQSLSYREQAAIISQVLNKPITVVSQSEAQWAEENKEYVPEPIIQSLYAYLRFRSEKGGHFQAQTDQLITGHVTFQEFIQKHKAEFIAATM